VTDDRILLDRPWARDIDSSVAKIAAEFKAGFEKVAQIDRPAVAMFGSARVAVGSPPYEAARAAARLFGPSGWGDWGRRKAVCDAGSAGAPGRGDSIEWLETTSL